MKNITFLFYAKNFLNFRTIQMIRGFNFTLMWLIFFFLETEE